MKVIITGAAGFIGSHAAEHFLAQDCTVIGLDNLSRPGSLHNLSYLNAHAPKGKFRFQHADIRAASDVNRIFKEHRDASLIIHEAGQVAVTTSVADPRTDFEVNAWGTLNILEATRAYLRDPIFLHASTNKVYGGLEHVEVVERESRYQYGGAVNGISERENIDFHSPYGCSKGCAEQYVRDYSRIYGLKSVVFRQSCIYGTRQFGMEDQGWVAWFSIASLLQRPLTIYGDGKQIRDLLWVTDLMAIYDLAVCNIDIAAGQIYNAGGGAENTLSLLELSTMLGNELGHSLDLTYADWRPGDQKVFVADCSKARRDLGWSPRVSPAKGLKALVAWARASLPLLEQLAPAPPGATKTYGVGNVA